MEGRKTYFNLQSIKEAEPRVSSDFTDKTFLNIQSIQGEEGSRKKEEERREE